MDKSVVARRDDPAIDAQLARIMEPIGLCPMGRLEQLFSATSGQDYELRAQRIRDVYVEVGVPPDVMDLALELQRDLAHHHGMWHRMALPDLFIAVTALANNFGVLHNDKDYERIAKVRPLINRRLG